MSQDIFDHVQPDDQHSTYVMCRPQYLSTKVANNVFMSGKEEADIPRAMNQWDRLAHIIEAFGGEVLELPPTKGAQDATFTANIGMNIGKTMILANYKAPGRSPEVEPARKFFTNLGFNCIQPPAYYEGIADSKKWKDGFYFGGWGLFSTQAAFDWIEKQCGVKIIRLREVNPKVYHLDCSLIVIDEENFIVCESGLDADSVKTLKKCGNVIFTPKGIETTGITNGILIPEKRIYLSGALNPEQSDYRKAMDFLFSTLDKLNYTVVFVDADAFEPSGGDISCLTLKLDI